MAITPPLIFGAGGTFLVSPNVGLMIWTLIMFAISMVLLSKLAFPRITNALEKRQKSIGDSIDAAERTRREADRLLSEYRDRLREARGQAEEIVERARKAAETHEKNAEDNAKLRREHLMEQARRDIDAETRRAIAAIRREVADLTVMATEKVTRKTLTDEDQRRLVQEAIDELDFTAIAPSGPDHDGGESR